MGTITKTVQQRMERFRQKQMKFDELTQPGWEDAADFFCERDEKSGTTKLRVPAVVQQRTNDDDTPHPLTTFAEPMESHDIVPGISEGTSHNQIIGCLSRQTSWRQHRYYVLKMSVNGASTTFRDASLKIRWHCVNINA